MATVKLTQLVIRTLAKPLSTKLKQQAKSHPDFRRMTIRFAQFLHTQEIKARVGLFKEAQPKVRMLNDETAIEKAANFFSEAFLPKKVESHSPVIAETVRSSRSNTKRRDLVDEKLSSLRDELQSFRDEVRKKSDADHRQLVHVADRDADVARVVDHLVDVLRRGAWIERTLDSDARWQEERRALRDHVNASREGHLAGNLEPS